MNKLLSITFVFFMFSIFISSLLSCNQTLVQADNNSHSYIDSLHIMKHNLQLKTKLIKDKQVSNEQSIVDANNKLNKKSK